MTIAAELGFTEVTLGLMIGKAVKLAEGQMDTHSKVGTVNPEFVCRIAAASGCGGQTLNDVRKMVLARDLWHIIPSDCLPAFCKTLLDACHRHCDPLLSSGQLTIWLVDEEGGIH